RRVEDLDLVDQHFHLARLEVRIDGALRAPAHLASNLEDELAAHALGDRERFLAVGIEHHLRQALAVAQVDEDHAAMVAAAMSPAGEGDDLVHQRGIDPAAVVRAHHPPPDDGCDGGTTPIEMMYFS